MLDNIKKEKNPAKTILPDISTRLAGKVNNPVMESRISPTITGKPLSNPVSQTPQTCVSCEGTREECKGNPRLATAMGQEYRRLMFKHSVHKFFIKPHYLSSRPPS